MEIKDPVLNFITITGVVTTHDLKTSKVYFSSLSSSEDVLEEEKALNKAKGYIRKLLYKRLNLKFISDLVFLRDLTYQYVKHIDDLIAKI